MGATEENVFDVYRDRVERPLVRLFRVYGRPEIRWFGLGMAANVVARLASLLPPLVLGIALDAIFVETEPFSLPVVPDAWLPATQSGQFWFSAALIFGAFLTTALFTWVYGIAANVFAHRVMHAVRTDSFERMQRLDMPFFDDKQTGEVMSVLNNDASNLEVFLDDALQNSARLGVMLLGIAVILFYLNAQLAFVTLIAVPAMVLFTLWFMRVVEPIYVAQRASVGDLNTRLENSLGGIQLVKTATTEEYETERVRRASYEYFEQTMRVIKYNYVYRPGMELLAGVAFGTTFVVGGIWLFSGAPGPFTGELTVGTFVTFLLMTQRFVTPLAEVSNIIDQYENAKASSERVFGLMDIPVRITDAPDAVSLDDPEGCVEYDHVDFAYPENALKAAEQEASGERVLHDIDFEVEPGNTVALIGPTGAGKSTLLKLLLRLYEVDRGEIRVDGHDVRDLTLSSLRGAIGYVGQDAYLFDGTVAENVQYGDFDAGEERIRESARAAEAHEFILDLPKGYDTRIGERGVKLSGGQQQRLSIARTILQDPEILILDEATSDVDTETERLIQESLDRLTAERTTFAIAHRLSTVKGADTILVIEGGRITERGTHEELLETGGTYATLWGVQAGEVETGSDSGASED
ncbi:ABC transporter ATP-binding protein [Halalkalicoccus subterraneus]|uniref:ABC transporter ATP-binding protein n=1 Tax=Halalkalicoccus subterraneus TaxID=2675002 RepID=UPI000EFAD708|nr:ABC transporter ATP-binding protein [Halalkalicoccus subterraneus]